MDNQAAKVQDAGPENRTAGKAPRGAGWNFCNLPLFPPGRPSQPQGLSPLAAPSMPHFVQPKLAVGRADDPLEREADTVANQVLRMPDPAVSISTAPPKISRKCATCEAEEKKELQTKPAGTGGAHGEAPPIVHEVLQEPGQPLDASSRAFFEPRFGRDFSHVRVHTDAAAAASAQAVGAHAYTVGSRIVLTAGRAPSSATGRHLLAHELAHVVQQNSGHGQISLVLRRQPAAEAAAPDQLDLGADEDLSEKNPRLASFAAAARQSLSASPKAIISVGALWSSKSAFAPGAAQTPDQLREAARRRAESVRSALARLGVPAASLSVVTPDLNESGVPQGSEGHIRLTILGTPFVLPPPLPIPLGGPVAPSPLPSIDIDKDTDLSEANSRLIEKLKWELLPRMRDPGGTAGIVIYVGQDEIDPKVTQQNQAAADARLMKVRETMTSIGIDRLDISTDLKVVPKADPRAGRITIMFKPKSDKPEDAGFDLEKFTTFQVQAPSFTLVVKVPKSIELKAKWVEGKFSIPKGASVKFKPVRGLPGVEISLAGALALGAAPAKFSLSAAINFKGFKIEASSEANLSTRTLTSGLYVTLIEEGHKYQVPSSVWDDLNKAGAQLQKAVNALMGVANPPAATKPVGQPLPPEQAAGTDGLSNLADAVELHQHHCRRHGQDRQG